MCNIKEKINKYKGNKFFTTIISIIIVSLILLFASYLIEEMEWYYPISTVPVGTIFLCLFYIILPVIPILLITTGILRMIKKSELATKFLKYTILALSLSFLFYSLGTFLNHFFISIFTDIVVPPD